MNRACVIYRARREIGRVWLFCFLSLEEESINELTVVELKNKIVDNNIIGKIAIIFSLFFSI